MWLPRLPGNWRLFGREWDSAAVAIALLGFYSANVATEVGGGNWGEFQTFGYLGGIPHSPGYPLLTAAIRYGTRILKFLEPAHAANLVNAFFAAVAGLLLYLIGKRLSGSRIASLVAATIFATGYSVWEHSTQAEMMSLQTALVFGVIFALLRYEDRPAAANLALFGFATGISLTNHGISLFMVPATAAYVVSRDRRILMQARPLAAAAGALLLGLLPWLYFLRALFVKVPISRPENFQTITLEDAAYIVLRKPLLWVSGTNAPTSPLADEGSSLLSEWPRFAHDVLREYGWIWIALAVAGFVVLARSRPRLLVWVSWTGLTTLWFALSTTPLLDANRYFVVIYCLLAVSIASALGQAIRRAQRLDLQLRFQWRIWRASGTFAPLAMAVLLTLAGLQVWQQLSGPAAVNVKRQRENAAEQGMLGEAIVRQVAPNSVYMTNWDSSWYPRYVIHVKGLNRGLEVRTTDFWTMGIEQAESVLDGGRRLYIQHSTPEYERRFRVERVAGIFYEVLLK